MSVNPLKLYNILIADADNELGRVLRTILQEMGFERVDTTRSGKDALHILKNKPIDFLITEWNTLDMKGVDVIDHIRRHPASPNPILPIIMLTGRAERSDVQIARDRGINEYVIKPFSAKTIYSRLERIVEKPRPFVVSHQFIGPDRRHKGTPPAGVAERRTRTPKAIPTPDNASRHIQDNNQPKVWMPDYALKNKLGKGKSLGDFITPEQLNQAQNAIEAITSESLQWIKTNLADLSAIADAIAKGQYFSDVVDHISELALLINSRAGTFGYTKASEVAYMLYLFCRNDLELKNTSHHVVIQKHIDVLRVIFANDISGSGDDALAMIVDELRNLTTKLTT